MKETSKAYRIFEFFKYSALVLIPILNIYSGVFIINFGFVILLLLMILEILINKGRFAFNREILAIFSLMIALNIITGFLHMGEIDLSTVMNNTFYVVVIALVCTYFVRSDVVDRDRFFKYLSVVGVLCTAFIVLQYVLYLRGVILYGYIPGLSVDKSVVLDPNAVSITWGRPTSFFTEPAHYAIFILPVYTLSLFRRKFLRSAFFLIGLVISTSSTGLFGLLVVTAVFIIKEKKIPIIIKWIFAIIGIVLVIQFIPAIDKSGILEKLKFVNLTDNTRVFGTLAYFQYFGTKEVFFGVGLNQLANYMKMFTTENVANYASALFYAFFSFGLVGGSIWTYYVCRLHRLSRFKLLYIVFILVYVSDQILFNRNLVYLLLILYVFSDKRDEAPAALEVET